MKPFLAPDAARLAPQMFKVVESDVLVRVRSMWSTSIGNTRHWSGGCVIAVTVTVRARSRSSCSRGLVRACGYDNIALARAIRGWR